MHKTNAKTANKPIGMTSKKGNLSKRCSRQLRSLRFGDFDQLLKQAVDYANNFDGKTNITIDTSGEHYTTSTCNCCANYTPGIGRAKTFFCSDENCPGNFGVLRDCQGAVNICIQMIDKYLKEGTLSNPQKGT